MKEKITTVELKDKRCELHKELMENYFDNLEKLLIKHNVCDGNIKDIQQIIRNFFGDTLDNLEYGYEVIPEKCDKCKKISLDLKKCIDCKGIFCPNCCESTPVLTLGVAHPQLCIDCRKNHVPYLE